MRPLIGVTTSELRPSHLATTRRHGEPAHPEMALGMTYLRTLDAAGAIPVVLPPTGTDHLQGLLERLDGICLSGGPDLDPGAYGATERHTQLGPTEPSLDAFELSLAKEALTRNIPILAICRGSQALNVACGGTLHQHIDGHRQTEAATEPTHEVHIETGSKLHRITRTRTLAVNSFHHQAVDRVGDGLSVTARATDGTIEGIEGPGAFTVGVQWHAETLFAHLPLFEALVRAAARTELRIAA
ncbi:gamma-glutamyl-gamma-aminobutyrate hydrolase family protein [Solirubrobacter sp. CPCC 204708]|uniref:Gamma-glutamyl-gamma-aminobutyrate hydrolase family protein n=1 Tax=Solirubrobacter deserti TaxID=2282478 RepID=A0ABT4RQE5_9ACTN|nr:gamma-glutamyl-gamma-aminobutyrate hydrolase family protein [Solirubrobacter deserti]MBE2320500.1 gamma-glutamyl-gamma-aminobutyrate hydrolase family protein [Solirubrobacter deserti]MDA0140746.1 gamma-glutamyl-gamma-aminobutyrate hydrolase family protein [Solirubrobacter deserti]